MESYRYMEENIQTHQKKEEAEKINRSYSDDIIVSSKKFSGKKGWGLD